MTEKYSQKKLLSNTCIKQYKVKVTVVISLGKIGRAAISIKIPLKIHTGCGILIQIPKMFY